MKIGQFEVLETLGGGGSGIVYKARNETLGRVVAIKQLNKAVEEGDRIFTRFRREAQIMASVRSPHVVAVYSFQIIDGRPLLEMECLEHGSLEDALATAPLPFFRVLEIVEDILTGLHALHQAGIVHRDVKPANVLQDEGGRYKLGDFGISLAESGAKPTIEAATIRYLAPECTFEPPICDARSDLYSVGMLTYELLLGNDGFRKAFAEFTPIAAFAPKWLQWMKDPDGEATPLHTLRPDIPVAVSQFVARLMAKDPARRYATAEAALQAIRLLPFTRRIAEGGAAAPGARPATPVDSGRALAWELSVCVRKEGEQEATVTFVRSPVSVGSSPNCDLVLSDPYVSAEHAQILVSRGQLVFDDQSRNGSFVNGEPVKRASLGTGGEVRIPPYTLDLTLRVTNARPDTLHRERPRGGGPARPEAPEDPGTLLAAPAPAALRTPVLRLVKAPGGMATDTYPLTGDRVVIGRGARAQIRLDSTTVSRQHVELLRQVDGRWLALDLNSSNGMAVNGQRVNRHVLCAGDELAVGPEVVFTFMVPVESAG